MPLVKCKECGHQVSTNAKACPNCGAKPPPPPSSNAIKFLLIGLGIIILILIFAGSDDEQSSSTTPTVTKAEKEGKELAYIELHKKRIKERLKDPGSAQFRNVKVYHGVAPVVCGEVNAKNSFGGYIGFQRFISGGTIQVLESDMATDEMDKTWDQICRDK